MGANPSLNNLNSLFSYVVAVLYRLLLRACLYFMTMTTINFTRGATENGKLPARGTVMLADYILCECRSLELSKLLR